MKREFKELTAKDIPILSRYFSLRANKTCDSTFLSSYLWKDSYHPRYYLNEGRAVQWLSEWEGKLSASLPLCTAEDLPYYFMDMQAYMNHELGMKMTVELADEAALEILDLAPDRYEITEERDAADYLYDADLLRRLPGKRYHKKKNHINAFLREYEGRYEYRTLSCCDEAEILEFLNRWKAGKADDGGHHLEMEYEGIAGVLDQCRSLQVKMAGIRVDGRLEAFTIGSYNKELRMAIIHIEKANPDIRGMYPFINQQFLANDFADALLVNREDDMGLPGLRKAKESYYPIEMVKKYRIVQK